jgi:AcrR family transcriptional regulator
MITPQRSHGKARFAAVLEAGAAAIAEHGYDGATMAEIAARAGAPIGSLYRFFPNKEILAEALIQRYAVLIDQFFDAIESRLALHSTESLADALMAFGIDIRGETKAMIALLEARSQWSPKRTEFRNLAIKRIARVLTTRAPKLRRQEAKDAAVVLLHNMKTLAALKFDPNKAAGPGAIRELYHMNRLYLADKLGKGAAT